MKLTTPIDDEIDRIRLEIYEEIKDLSQSEIIEFFRKATAPIIKKYGLKVVTYSDIVKENKK
jgi:hypothetical protein